MEMLFGSFHPGRPRSLFQFPFYTSWGPHTSHDHLSHGILSHSTRALMQDLEKLSRRMPGCMDKVSSLRYRAAPVYPVHPLFISLFPRFVIYFLVSIFLYPSILSSYHFGSSDAGSAEDSSPSESSATSFFTISWFFVNSLRTIQVGGIATSKIPKFSPILTKWFAFPCDCILSFSTCSSAPTYTHAQATV